MLEGEVDNLIPIVHVQQDCARGMLHWEGLRGILFDSIQKVEKVTDSIINQIGDKVLSGLSGPQCLITWQMTESRYTSDGICL